VPVERVKISLDGREIEAPEGAPLVEVIKNSGTFISNLCYIDGRPPYAGCRTCLVEIEGARGYQLSCTSRVSDGMVVRTQGHELFQTRQAVLSLILSYHSDRCLTCHRVVKCKPGDTCLRDDTVTHRCLTCSKNYRCELQTTCEMLDMAGYEPWDGDTRTYYTTPQPPPDQANPFLEFDPQMCIICTRCVRACDELRHTGAITLAGRGPTTRIEFGQGGAVHDSNCDFCGACIDVCPTATLMEHPNKWSATQTERWTPTTCTQCSVGCSIYLGSKKGRGTIVRPDMGANPVSADQLCVRGRFHYDAVKNTDRLALPLIRRNGGQETASWDEALEFTAARIAQVREEHGPEAIGFLASPLASNEENYLVSKVARAIVGTNNVDSSASPVLRAAAGALSSAFGREALPADMTRLGESKTILVVADDLEASHNVAALRIKDAVVRGNARLVVVSSLWGELNDFAALWVRPPAGEEAAVVAALATAVEQAKGVEGERVAPPPGLVEDVSSAASLIADGEQPLSVVYGLPHTGSASVRAVTAALANVTLACAGGEAGQALFVLPQEANGWGMRDLGGAHDLLPGRRPVSGEEARGDLQRLWGAQLPATAGLSFEEMLTDGRLKALVVMDDNPLMLAPGRTGTQAAFEKLDFLAVIDSLPTDTVRAAHVALPGVSPWAREGTTTSADRRVLRLNPAVAPQGEARQGWRILSELGLRLAERLNPGEIRINYQTAAEVMEEIAQVVPLYADATYRQLDSGAQQLFDGARPAGASRQVVSVPASAQRNGGFTLSATRGLYTSYEAAAIHSPDADRLHREDVVQIHPADAAALGIEQGATVVLRNSFGELRLRAAVTETVQQRTVHAWLPYDGGAALSLFEADQPAATVEVSRA
jgi:predicted molibdopterin-dependent oxidoreductase YjgC